MDKARQSADIVVVIPVGPGTDPAFVADTVESYIHYSVYSYKIILVDDSRQDIAKNLQQHFPGIDILHTQKSAGSMAGLYIMLSEAYRYALENYDFRLLFKLDTDALVIGRGADQDAVEYFAENPLAGIAGQYPNDYHGRLWDTGWPQARIINGTMTWKYIRRPVANLVLRKHYIRALRNGYRTGESVFGGAYFMSHALLHALDTNGLLPNYTLGRLNLGEDHLFGLLARSLGFQLGNLADEGRPFGCAWKGLAASPEQLHHDRKKVIHSTRSWKQMNEQDIRNYFQLKRLNPVAKVTG